jgi:tRNA modification GTPase
VADDTIAAIATASGRAAIAVVRVSGARAHEAARAVLDAWPEAPRTAVLATARDPRDGTVIDRVLVTRFDAPRSYTGEPMAELSSHGGVAVPAALLGALIAAGARLALPGEFTRRAVLGGKLDLVQAEAVGDLIDARTDAMRRAAATQLDGGLSRRLGALRDELLDLEALIAYDIDFPEEDDGPVPRERIAAATRRAHASLDALLASAPAGALVREGATVVIAGAPNVGKSSLFNALLGEARAIVTEIPGTTRDAIEAAAEHRGWPLRLVDTAGLRATSDVVERLGIEVSERWLARAHVVLACGETAAAVREVLSVIGPRSPALGGGEELIEAPIIAVLTKGDLAGDGERARATIDGVAGVDGVVRVSAVTGEGLGALLDAIARVLGERYGAIEPEMPLLTRARHVRAITEARDELAAFALAWAEDALPAPVAAVHVRQAVHALDILIGAVDAEDVLGRVFEGFCVGK